MEPSDIVWLSEPDSRSRVWGENFLYPGFSRMFTIHQGMDFHDPWIQQAVDLRMGSHDMIQVMRRSLGPRRKDQKAYEMPQGADANEIQCALTIPCCGKPDRKAAMRKSNEIPCNGSDHPLDSEALS